MPLTKGQIAALRVIAAARDPESYVAGSVPLNRDRARYSADIDIFHDQEQRVAEAAEMDADALTAAGFTVRWQRRSGAARTLIAARDGEDVKLEWVVDSDFRFFPVVPDPELGFMLHPVDLAINKALAAANRRELRDIVDLVGVHGAILPLGAVVWAAVEKSPGFTPESMIEEIRRNANHPAEEWRSLITTEPIDPVAVHGELRRALDAAEAFVRRMPTAKSGLLFLSGDRIVEPEPHRLDDYVTHAGSRRGHWPSSPAIAAAMAARFKQP